MPQDRLIDLLSHDKMPVIVADAACHAELHRGLEDLVTLSLLPEPFDPAVEFPGLPDPDVAGSIIFTSGSTGASKGIVHSQSGLPR
ncbi:MAG: hypothetical protein HOI34_11355 [Rhodospirillaceae bacterium]|jgi:acyl-coenzyme A synthetase/AMP-(fatty) acid ligase|nr:hypothetical protein [Rhodospirillaceae bacterium]MBT6204285.1 hypothetical protein [Rhodospirillaceae bacterium]MBT6512764.1 hypothetical protein [Rhodospirillaceae bacterium]